MKPPKPLKPELGETRPAGWFVDKTTYQVSSGWKLVEFRRCYRDGRLATTCWKPVWKHIP